VNSSGSGSVRGTDRRTSSSSKDHDGIEEAEKEAAVEARGEEVKAEKEVLGAMASVALVKRTSPPGVGSAAVAARVLCALRSGAPM
jgi:hypothetical protein